MSGSGIAISAMQNFAENLGSSSAFDMGSGIGNIIELGGDDLGDDLGAGMLSNTRVSSRPAGSSAASQQVSALGPIDDIGITSLEPLESISFDIPSSSSSSSSSAFPEISINRSSGSSSGDAFSLGGNDPFSNSQTASGPSIALSAAPRMNQEEEKKKKMEMINKLNRMESKGFTLTKRFTMDNSVDEIQEEYDRLVDQKNLEASLRFQRQCMMGVVTGMEMLNNKFDPFGWELDGWSESVHENIEDFDEVFEELFDKYKGRGNMPPELKLMMSLVGSGFMFHMSNSFFRAKSAAMDPMNVFKSNPELAKQFAAAAAQQAGPGFGNFMGAAMGVSPQMPQNGSGTGSFFQSSAAPMPQVPQPMAANSVPAAAAPRREMKGPSGVDDILKTFQEVRSADMEMSSMAMQQNVPNIFTSQPAIQAASEISSIHSTPMSEMSTDTTRTAGGTVQRRGGRRKGVTPASGNTMTLNL